MQVRSLVCALGAVTAVFWSSCGTTTPSGPPPTLACPAPIAVVSPDGSPVAVTFQAPSVSGPQPITASCVPASGSLFAIGMTSVSCSALVSNQRVACSFNVSVAPPPRLEKTKMLAFGDSITFGSGSACPGGVSTRFGWTPAALFGEWDSLATPPPTAYPNVVQTMLRDRYTAQTPVVVNAGLPGEFGNDSETRRRFTRTLNENGPEVLLLQEGINDLHSFDFYGIPHALGITRLVEALRAMSLEARGRGIRVFIGTLLPERPDGCRAYAVPPASPEDMIALTNNQIRAMAAAESLDLVDLAAVFQGHLDTYLGPDGLHPTAAGYAAIADAFYESIRAKLEVRQPGAAVSR